MNSSVKLEHNKTKNEEIADLVEQQVQGVIDPFATTFTALWGTPAVPSTPLSEYEHVEKQTSLKSDITGDIAEIETQGEKHTCQDESMSKILHESPKTCINLNISSNSQQIITVIQKTNNFALVGFLTFLNALYPEGQGIYSINGLARIAGMSRSSIRGNLQNLEKLRFITMSESEIFLSSNCREWLNLNKINTNKDIHEQKQTSLNSNMAIDAHDQKQTYNKNIEVDSFSNDICTNLDMEKNRQKNSSSSLKNKTTTTDEINSNMNKFRHMDPIEKTRLRLRASELFWIAITTKIEPELFSMQTLYLYNQIAIDRGNDYAAALFIFLLPKAKDNPTGYISSAYKKGAEPTPALITKVKEIWDASDDMRKSLKSQDVKRQIQEAMEKDDVESLLILTQMQAKIKKALQLFAWTETVESLLEKENRFINSLFEI